MKPENAPASGTGAPAPPRREETLAEINRLLEEDLAAGRELAEAVRARDIRVRYHTQRMREEVDPIEKRMAALTAQREKLREVALALWTESFEGETTIEIPLGKVSRRYYRELLIRDKGKLLDALDRLDRLDLVDYSFDEKGLLHLLDEGKLAPQEDSIEVRGRFNLQVFTRKGRRRAHDQPKEA